MVAIVKKELKIERNLYEILQIISVSIFDKTQLNQLLDECQLQKSEIELSKQLNLFDYNWTIWHNNSSHAEIVLFTRGASVSIKPRA